MAANKAPGTNGFFMFFFLKFWETVKHDIIYIFWKMNIQLENLSRLNYVNVTLTSKVEDASRVGDFRLISLLNCAFKIFSKVLVNRLRGVMDNLVDESQTTFIKGRSIMEIYGDVTSYFFMLQKE